MAAAAASKRRPVPNRFPLAELETLLISDNRPILSVYSDLLKNNPIEIEEDYQLY